MPEAGTEEHPGPNGLVMLELFDVPFMFEVLLGLDGDPALLVDIDVIDDVAAAAGLEELLDEFAPPHAAKDAVAAIRTLAVATCFFMVRLHLVRICHVVFDASGRADGFD